jgi:hypothetical protein
MMSDLASKGASSISTTNVPHCSADEDESCEEMMREIEVVKEDSTLAVDERDRLVAKIHKRYAAKRLAAEQVRKDRQEELDDEEERDNNNDDEEEQEEQSSDEEEETW